MPRKKVLRWDEATFADLDDMMANPDQYEDPMIQEQKDELGNVTGYFDTAKGEWVPKPQPVEEKKEQPKKK